MKKNLPSERPNLALKKENIWTKMRQQSKACYGIIRFIMTTSHKSFISMQFERDSHISSPLTCAISSAHPQQRATNCAFKSSWKVCICELVSCNYVQVTSVGARWQCTFSTKNSARFLF